jgi:hypothetical protein
VAKASRVRLAASAWALAALAAWEGWNYSSGRDLIHTPIRPEVAVAIGARCDPAADGARIGGALSTVGAAGTAPSSHALNTGLTLGVEASPEPLSNLVVPLVLGVTFVVPFSSSVRASRELLGDTALAASAWRPPPQPPGGIACPS